LTDPNLECEANTFNCCTKQERQTDMAKLIVAFDNFVKAKK